MSSLRRRLLGAACLFAAAAIWGGMYVVSKYVLDYIPPMTLLAIRLVIGGAALLLVMVTSRSPWVGVRDLPRMALLGLVGFGISLAAQFIDTRLSSASHGAVITSVTPAFILVFAAGLLKERITWAKVAAVAIATAGALLVVEQHAARALEVCHRGAVLELGRHRVLGTGRALLANAEVRRLDLGG